MLLEGLNNFKLLFHRGSRRFAPTPGLCCETDKINPRAAVRMGNQSVRQICARGKIRLFELVKAIIINLADHQQFHWLVIYEYARERTRANIY